MAGAWELRTEQNTIIYGDGVVANADAARPASTHKFPHAMLLFTSHNVSSQFRFSFLLNFSPPLFVSVYAFGQDKFNVTNKSFLCFCGKSRRRRTNEISARTMQQKLLSSDTTMRRRVRKMHLRSCFMASPLVSYETMLISGHKNEDELKMGLKVVHHRSKNVFVEHSFKDITRIVVVFVKFNYISSGTQNFCLCELKRFPF